MNILLLILTSAGFSLIAVLLLTFILIKLSHRYAWYDKVDERKIHTGNIPAVGGIGILVAALTGFFLFLSLSNKFSTVSLTSFSRFLPFLLAFLLIHLVGLIDDFINMPARYKLLIQIGAACIVAFTGNTIETVTLPWFDLSIRFGPVSYFITIIWLVGVCNALNFLDGMDGLAGGVSAIGALFYGIIFLLQAAYISAAVSFALFGALLGFLFFNRPPAKIFMGDCGALFLGFVLGAIPLLENSGSVPLSVAMLPVSILLLPILDTFTSIFRRTKQGKRIYFPDKGHTHHKLLDKGTKEPTILLIMYGLALFPAVSILLWIVIKSEHLFWLTAFSWASVLSFFIYLEISVNGKAKISGPSMKKKGPEAGSESAS